MGDLYLDLAPKPKTGFINTKLYVYLEGDIVQLLDFNTDRLAQLTVVPDVTSKIENISGIYILNFV